MLSSDGLFISVDGPSGVGKTTTVHALARLLRNEGRPVHITAEPSEGLIGKLARELTEEIQGISLACLYAADRYHHLANQVLPRVDMGEIVITDRYIASALVMQQTEATGCPNQRCPTVRPKADGGSLLSRPSAVTAACSGQSNRAER
jgi:thymidylate kinase